MRLYTGILAATIVAAGFGTTAEASCEPGKAGVDLTADEAQAVYECLSEDLHAGYVAGGKRWIPAEFVNDYRGWTQASTFPAAPGFHSGRFLVTWVNEVGAEAYMAYSEEPVIPAGTVLAKESFSVDDDGIVQPGPLFLMQKVAEGTSPETMDWYYMTVSPTGVPLALDAMTACNDCHVGSYGFQGGVAYPVVEARVQ